MHKKQRYAAPQHKLFSVHSTEGFQMLDKQTVASFEDLVAPMITLNKIALGYTEKMVELNLAVMRKQSDMLLESWSEMLAVKDADAVKEYLAHQGEVATDVVESYVADAKAATQLNQEVADDVRKLVEESITKATKQAA